MAEHESQGARGLIRFTLGQAVFLNLVFIMLMVVGVFCTFDLPVERYPNVSMGKVIISGFLPGASPDEVEALVTRKIEDALDDLENVEYIRSQSFRQRSSILVKFIDDVDYDALYDELRFKVLSIQNELPAEMDPPQFTVINVNEWLPAVNVNLAGPRTNRALTLMAEELKLVLERIDGVQEVEIQGEYTREFHVSLDPDKMNRMRVTFQQVADALNAANISIPAGDFQTDVGEYVIVVDERFRTREQVVNTIVRRDADGSFVTVADVLSDARLDYRDPVVIASVGGDNSVTIKVTKMREGNALDIVDEVERVVAEYGPVLEREDVRAVLSADQRVYIDDSITTLGTNLLVGIVLVCGCIWIVMGLRNAMLTCVGVPFAFLVTMVIMWITGNSLNEITLFSFVLVSGIIVDDAIVVVENIYRHIQEGKPLKDAVVDGTAEVFWPVISATSTTVAAFLPMLIMTGSTGEFFAQVPKAVTFAIAASLIECLIILPSHVLDWPGASKLRQDARVHADPAFMAPLKTKVDRVLVWMLGNRALSLVGVFLAFAVGLVILVVSMSGAANLINIQFFPDEYNLFYVSMEGPSGSSVDQMDERAREVSRFLMAMGPDRIKNCSGLAGLDFSEDYQTLYGSNRAMVTVELPAKEDQSFDDPIAFLEDIRAQVLERFGGEGWNLRVWAEKGGPPAGKDVNVRVLGSDMESVTRLEAMAFEVLTTDERIAPHLVDLNVDTGTPARVFRLSPRPRRVAEYGLTPTQVAWLAGSVLDGRFAGEYRLADEDVDIRVMIDPAFMASPDDALDVPVIEYDNGPVRVGDLCTVQTYNEPGQLNRFRGQRAVTITANIVPGAPISAAGVVRLVRQRYQAVQADYPGATLDFAGEFESTGKSFTSLAYAFAIAIMIMYVILATQFRSYIQPVIILSAVVFALTGVIWGTFLTRALFTVNSFIATVGVAGVVVNDSLVLLEFINKRYAEGMTRHEAIREGVRIRLRPILLTTLTTTLGLLPLALGFPYYSLVWGTMATTFVTGLCTATALTLFIMPVEWSLIMQYVEWRTERKARKKAGGDPQPE